MENLKKKIIELRKITKLPVELVEIAVINSLSYEEVYPLVNIKKYERFAKNRICDIFSNEGFLNIVKKFPSIVTEIHIFKQDSWLKVKDCDKKFTVKKNKKFKSTQEKIDWWNEWWNPKKRQFKLLKNATFPEEIAIDDDSEYLQDLDKIIIYLEHDNDGAVPYLEILYEKHTITSRTNGTGFVITVIKN